MSLSFSYAEKVYWDEERLVEAGQFGTLKTISQGINLYIFVADMKNYEPDNQSFTIRVFLSKNGRDFIEKKEFAILSAFSTTEFAYDFDVVISGNSFFVTYRSEASTVVVEQINIQNGARKKIIEISDAESIAYLPIIEVFENNIYLLYYQYKQTEELYFAHYNLEQGMITQKKLGGNLQSVLNPFVTLQIKMYFYCMSRRSFLKWIVCN